MRYYIDYDGPYSTIEIQKGAVEEGMTFKEAKKELRLYLKDFVDFYGEALKTAIHITEAETIFRDSQ